MANATHKNFKIEKGDAIIITASIIPGNERTVTNVINSLMKIGASVYHERIKDIHVSGHGSAEELKLMISLTKPKFFMPIHGVYKHLKAHCDIAASLKIKPSNIQIAQNGDILELSNKSFKIINSLSLSNVYIDGNEIGDLESITIKDRKQISSEGVVCVSFVLSSSKNG